MKLISAVCMAAFCAPCLAQDIANITTPAQVIAASQDAIVSLANADAVLGDSVIDAGDSQVAALTSSLFFEMKMGLLSNNIKWLHDSGKLYVAGDIARIESTVYSINAKYRSEFFTASIFYITNPTNTEFNSKRLPVLKRNRIIGGGFGEVVSWLENYEADIFLVSVDGTRLPKPIVLLERKTNMLRVGISVRGGMLESCKERH